MGKPVVIDLCCGSGGWATGFLAEGYDVIGLDIVKQPNYPGRLILGDVRQLARDVCTRGSSSYRTVHNAAVIVASPPGDEFARWQMPWTRARRPPEPDLSIVNACWQIGTATGRPLILENVRKAQDWLGKAAWHCGSFYLWGSVPALMPKVFHRPKESYSSTERLKRARVPEELARWIARCFVNVNSVDTTSRMNLEDMAARIAKEQDDPELNRAGGSA